MFQEEILGFSSVDLLSKAVALIPEMSVKNRLEKLIGFMDENLGTETKKKMYAQAFTTIKEDRDSRVKFYESLPDDGVSSTEFLVQIMKTSQALTNVFGDDSHVFDDLFKCVMKYVQECGFPGLEGLAMLNNSEQNRYMSFLSVAEDLLSDSTDGSVPNLDALLSRVKELIPEYQRAYERAYSDRQYVSETEDETSDDEKAALVAQVKKLEKTVRDLRGQLADTQSAKSTPAVGVSVATAAVVASAAPAPAVTAASVLSGSAVSKAVSATEKGKKDEKEAVNLSFKIIANSEKASAKGVKRSIVEVDASAVGDSTGGKPPQKRARKPAAKKSDGEKKKRVPRARKPRAAPKASGGVSLTGASDAGSVNPLALLQTLQELLAGRSAVPSSSADKEKPTKKAAAPKTTKKAAPSSSEDMETQDFGL